VLYGVVHFDELTIRINKEAAPEQQSLTLLHEIKHAIHEDMRGNGSRNAMFRNGSEEDYLERIDAIEYQVLTENPALLRYLIKMGDYAKRKPS
jgi:hypothetical protein